MLGTRRRPELIRAQLSCWSRPREITRIFNPMDRLQRHLSRHRTTRGEQQDQHKHRTTHC